LKKSLELLLSLRIFNHYKNSKDIKNALSEKIKEVCLKCYLILYASQYNAISVNTLLTKFELSEENILNIVNSMILEGELNAKWGDGKILEVEKCETNNLKIMKRLEGNLNTITQQNLNLIELVYNK
jgi:hypothetical protein